jgi:hypothetical protein
MTRTQDKEILMLHTYGLCSIELSCLFRVLFNSTYSKFRYYYFIHNFFVEVFGLEQAYNHQVESAQSHSASDTAQSQILGLFPSLLPASDSESVGDSRGRFGVLVPASRRI